MGKQKKKGYNVYQLRMYSLRDELLSKEIFKDHAPAKKKLVQYLEDEQYGPTYSRGEIRQLDPIRKNWLVTTGINNPRAMFLNPEDTLVAEWKLTLYDMCDTIMESAQFPAEVTKKQVELVMLNKNASYGVVSAREIGSEQFTITRIQINNLFHLTVMVPNKTCSNSCIPKSGKNPALAYAKAIAEDRAETNQVLRRLQQDG